ncbi:MAG: hypothetical protein ACPGYX_09040 [Oceanobacter sp.]
MNYESLESLMGVVSPWIIHDVRSNRTYQRVEVCIGMARTGWFGTRRAVQNFNGHHKVWRHANLGDQKCIVRVDFPENGDLPNAPWTGDVSGPFTNCLGKQVIQLISEGLPLGTIARILQVDADVLWQFKRGLDTGKLGANLSSPVAEQEIPEEKINKEEVTSKLPDATDGIWHELLAGEKELEFRNLGLRLVLVRLRQQYALAQNREVKQMKAQQLRHYFEKNQGAASHEIDQILGAGQ